MVIKELLGLFFKYPVKALVVMDGSDGSYLGIIRKEKAVEFAATNSNLDMDLGEDTGSFMAEFTSGNIRSAFDSMETMQTVPVIDRGGKFVRLESPWAFMKWAEDRERVDREKLEKQEQEKKEQEKKERQTAAVEPVSSVSRPHENGYAILNQLLIPVLVTNPARLIIFANSSFLNSFNVEKEFILHQKMGLFLPKVRLDKSLEGSFTYQHKKWGYKVNYQADRIFIVFSEIHIAKQEGYPQDLDRILRDKSDLRSMVDAYECWIIRKVQQKTRQNVRQTAQILKVTEETLKYKIQKMK